MEVEIPIGLSYEEEWKNMTLEGCEHFQISNYGRLRNIETGRYRKVKDNGYGYLTVGLRPRGAKGKQITIYIHREVARLFLSDFSEELQVNHKDKNKYHNFVSNLEIVSDSENKIWSKEEYLQGHLKAQGKIVQMYDKEGNLIIEHLGLWDFCRKYNFDPRTVQRVIKGERKSYKGYIFKYKER